MCLGPNRNRPLTRTAHPLRSLLSALRSPLSALHSPFSALRSLLCLLVGADEIRHRQPHNIAVPRLLPAVLPRPRLHCHQLPAGPHIDGGDGQPLPRLLLEHGQRLGKVCSYTMNLYYEVILRLIHMANASARYDMRLYYEVIL